MRIIEFGTTTGEIVVLIHGVNIPWQMWNKEIEHYSKRYHVLVPALDGHDAKSENVFHSIEDEAEQIKQYIVERYGTNVFMIIAMSMGAAIAFCMLADGKLHTDNLVLDSGVFSPTPQVLLHINNRIQLSLKNKTKARDEKTLQQLKAVYGDVLTPNYIEMADVMSDENLLAALNSIGHFYMPRELHISNTRIIAFHGTVFMEIMAKKSAKYLKKQFPQAYIKVFSGYHHGELSVNRPEEFIQEIEEAIK